MKRKINPNLIKLAEQTYNPELKVDETVLERQVEEVEATNVPDLKGYIYVPSIGLYVAKERSLLNLNWNQTQEELHKQSLRMPTIREFVDFINYLQQNKSRIQEAESILDDILTVRNPWRAEWLDAKFSKKGKQMYVSYNHRTINGELQPQTEEALEKCLMKDCRADVFGSANKQGLPTKEGGNIYFYHPRADYVARFDASSGRAVLGCGRVPEGHYASLGVFACCEGTSRSGK